MPKIDWIKEINKNENEKPKPKRVGNISNINDFNISSKCNAGVQKFKSFKKI